MKLPEMLSNRRTLLAIVIVVIIIVAAVGVAAIYARKGGNGGDGGNNHPEPVVAEAGADVTGTAGTSVKFNGSASTGPITEYWWDFSRINLTDHLRNEGSGKIVEHVFEDPGVYLVTLVVEGKGGKNSTDTLSAYINLNETKTGTVSLTHMNETFEWTVKTTIEKVVLTLKFPQDTIAGVPIYNANILVYVGSATPSYDTFSQHPKANEVETVKTLDVPVGQLAQNGGFSVEVRWLASPPTHSVDFTLVTLLQYSPS